MLVIRLLLLLTALCGFKMRTSAVTSSSISTVQPILYTDCDNTTADAAAADIDNYADSIFSSYNPGTGYYTPGQNLNQNNWHRYGGHRDRELFSVCPKNCDKPANVPLCRALKCRSSSGRRRLTKKEKRRLRKLGNGRDQNPRSYSSYSGPNYSVFYLNKLIQKLNVKAGQLSLSYGCQLTLYIDQLSG